MKFCDKLVKQRKNNNMSQEQLADKLGVSRQAISKWESGSTIPDMAKILELCKILNCNLEDLIDDGINSNKEIFQNKIDINLYMKEILDFITKTINMFSSMSIKEKIKCILEITFITIILYLIYIFIGSTINSIFYNFINIFPDNFKKVIIGITSVIYGLFSLISGIIIIIHIFKIRYLDYYITIEDNNAITKTIESPIEQEESITKTKFIEKNKNKIIIRDPKHSTYNFISFLGKIILLVIKFITLLIALPCLISFIFFIFICTITIFLIKDTIFFLGITLSLIGLILLNYIIIKFIYNFIINQKLNVKTIFKILIIGLSLSGIGIGISFVDLLTFENKTLTEKDIEYQTETINIDYKNNLILNFLNDNRSEVVIDENLDNIKLEITHSNKGYIDLIKYISNYYIDNQYIKFYNYTIEFYEFNLEENFIETTNYIIKQIKDKKIITNNYENITKIKIYSNTNNINNLRNNLNKIN